MARTWVAGEVVTASQMNEEVRDHVEATGDPHGAVVAATGGAIMRRRGDGEGGEVEDPTSDLRTANKRYVDTADTAHSSSEGGVHGAVVAATGGAIMRRHVSGEGGEVEDPTSALRTANKQYVDNSVSGAVEAATYTGDGSGTTRTISTAFTPRKVEIQVHPSDSASVSGTDGASVAVLSTAGAWFVQVDGDLSLSTAVALTSGGFTVNTTAFNISGVTYVYVAHA